MDIERAKSTVLEVFGDVLGLVSFPVSWKFGPVEGGHMVGTLYVDGRDFDFGFAFRATPGKAVAAHVLNLRVADVASNLLSTIDVEDMWESWGNSHTSWDESRGVRGFYDAVNSVAEHVTGLVESDIEAYANLLTVAYALKQLADRYRAA